MNDTLKNIPPDNILRVMVGGSIVVSIFRVHKFKDGQYEVVRSDLVLVGGKQPPQVMCGGHVGGSATLEGCRKFIPCFCRRCDPQPEDAKDWCVVEVWVPPNYAVQKYNS